jgi:chromosome partitioning protein
MNNVGELTQDHNKALKIEGVVVNQFHAQAKLPTLLTQQLKDEGFPVMEPYLSSSVKMKESHYAQLPLISFAPKHKLTQQLIGLFEGIEEGAKAEAVI